MTETLTTSECTRISAEVSILYYSLAQRLTIFLEFLLGYPGTNVSWAFVDDGTNIILSEQFIQPASFSESGDHALDSEEYYCYKRVSITLVYYPHSPNCLHMLCA